MSAARGFARKECFEILRTSRIIVLPAIFVFFAITGPILAKYTPELVQAVAGAQLGNLQLPVPTVNDAYGQWVKNLSQIGLFAIIISYGGIISAERRRGTAILVLTKPLGRVAFVLVKVGVHVSYLTVLTAVTTLLTWWVSSIIFGEAPGGALLTSSALWLSSACVYFALVTLFSTWLPSSAGAAGLGIAAFAVLTLASIWKPLADFSPAGLAGAAAGAAAGMSPESLLPMLLVSGAVCVAAVALSAWVFTRQEL